MKLHKAVFLLHDEANDRDDTDWITECGREVSIKTEGRFTCIHS
jgi:hypothetical protein